MPSFARFARTAEQKFFLFELSPTDRATTCGLSSARNAVKLKRQLLNLGPSFEVRGSLSKPKLALYIALYLALLCAIAAVRLAMQSAPPP
jgi:hypothetical protein